MTKEERNSQRWTDTNARERILALIDHGRHCVEDGNLIGAKAALIVATDHVSDAVVAMKRQPDQVTA